MDKWALIHDYRRAVASGTALAIRCPNCKDELVPVVVKDDEPGLRCLRCREVTTVGLHILDQMKKALDEQ